MLADEWDLPAEPIEWDITIPTDDASITRRRRALAPIQVLTDIERTKASLDGDFWHRYDLFNIALAVIDQVALAMGISAGRTWDETVEYATEQVVRQVPDAGQGQSRAVAERVVVSLVTTDVETVPYMIHASNGPAAGLPRTPQGTADRHPLTTQPFSRTVVNSCESCRSFRCAFTSTDVVMKS